jgi:uncharacterized protein YjbI with pentapeptide repeats
MPSARDAMKGLRTMTPPSALNVEDALHPGSRFAASSLAKSTFNDVNLRESLFDNVALTGAVFRNVCLAGATIDDANLEGLRINGILVSELLRVYDEGRQPR